MLSAVYCSCSRLLLDIIILKVDLFIVYCLLYAKSICVFVIRPSAYENFFLILCCVY
jgi:hypothetical protein